MPVSLKLGTRGSRLARWQADRVAGALRDAGGHDVEITEITTQGDRNLSTSLAEISDKALFTKELDVALIDGRIDLAVHSLKDLPTALPEALAIAAVGERAAPWDVFVAHPSFEGAMDDLPEGASVATSSLRRRAQLLAWRPDLSVPPVRGNVPTRIGKLDESDWHGLLLAEAGLARLGLGGRIRERVPLPVMLPATSQGAIGVVVRDDDRTTREALEASFHHEESERAVLSERAYLRRLEGGCQVPIGAHCRYEEDVLHLEGCVASLDGSRLLREEARGPAGEPEALGVRLAERLLDEGAAAILREVREAEQ